MCHSHMIKYYSAINRKKLLIHDSRWMNLKNIMVNEIKYKYYTLPDLFYEMFQRDDL